MSFDFKAATPDTSITDDNSGVFGADSQSATNPSWWSWGTIKTYLASNWLRPGQNLSDVSDAPTSLVNLGGCPIIIKKYIAGRYYVPPFVQAATSAALASATRVNLIPFMVLQKCTISELFVRT